MKKTYPQARRDLLAAAMNLEQWNLSALSGDLSPRSVDLKSFLRSVRAFKKALRAEARARAVPRIQFQAALGMMEES